MKIRFQSIVCVALLALGLSPLGAAAGQSAAAAQTAPPDRPVKVVFYPILVQAPIYGASVNVPSVPGGGGGDEGAISGSGSTDVSLNGLYMGGVEFDAKRVFGEVDFLWTKPSATRTLPHVEVASTIWLVTAKGGYRFYKGLGVTGGVRRLSLDLETTLEVPSFDTTFHARASDAVWDPFVGVEWRRDLAAKLSVVLGAEAGGFGVGTDSDFHLQGRADWQFVPHVSLRAGYELFHFKMTLDRVTVGAIQRTLTATQTLHGPEIGIGIVF